MILRGVHSPITSRARGIGTARLFGRFACDFLSVGKKMPQVQRCPQPRAGITTASGDRRVLAPSRNSVNTVVGVNDSRLVGAGIRPLQRLLSVRSGRDDREPASTDKAPLDVHVTHVDASSDKASAEADVSEPASDSSRSTVPEEGGKIIGKKDDNKQEPVTVRFLDVPGSEETREEKMTVVFTCTVS